MQRLKFMRHGHEVKAVKEGCYFVAVDERVRFFGKIEKCGECWLWTGRPDKDGYGKFVTGGGRTERAHRASWRLHNGEIPGGLLCLHRCDTPACVNPEHLFLGTHADNIRDMDAKGRRTNANAKITETTASKIKRRLADGESGAAIALDLRVGRQTVYGIKQGRTWRSA